MTTIDRLTEIEQCDEYDLFLVYDSSRPRTISAKNLRKFITESGFDPDAFISGRIDTDAEILYMTNRAGEEIEIGHVISTLAVHEIQELQNVPPLEAGKLFKVNSTGDRVVFESPFNLTEHFIQELANVPDIQPLGYLRGTADGGATEWIPSSGTKVGIQDDGVNKGDAHTLNFEGSLEATIIGETASIAFKDETGYVTLDTDQTINGKKNFKSLQRFGDVLQIYFSGGNPALDIFAGAGGIEFLVQDSGVGKTAIDISKEGVCSFPNTPIPMTDQDAYLGAYWRVCTDGALIFNDAEASKKDASEDKVKFTIGGVNFLNMEFMHNVDKVWTQAMSFNGVGTFWWRTNHVHHAIVRHYQDSQLIFQTPSGGDKYTLKNDGEDFSLQIKDIGDAIRVNDDDKSVTTYCNGKPSFESTDVGIALNAGNHGGNEGESKKRVTFGNNTGTDLGDKGYFGIHQHLPDGTWEKAWIKGEVDGGVSVYHDGQLRFGTGFDTVYIQHRPEGIYSALDFTSPTNRLRLFNAGTHGGVQVQDNAGAYLRTAIDWSQDGVTKLWFNNAATCQTHASGMDFGWNGAGIRLYCLSNGWLGLQNHGKHMIGRNGNTGEIFIANDLDQVKISLYNNSESTLHGTWWGSVNPSDATLKDNITPLDGLNKLNLLEPLEWTWKEENTPANDTNEPDSSTDGLSRSARSVEPTVTHKGFTAQSYQKVFPNQVETIDPKDLPDDVISDDPVLGIKKDITGFEMDALVVDAIKTLKAQNEDLMKRLDALESKA